MTTSQPGRGWPNVPVLLLCVLAPPLGLIAWVLGSEADRAVYLRSPWVRAGLGLLVLGSAPLLGIVALAKLGLWPDPDPNPIGPGLLFLFLGFLGTIALAVGAVRGWLALR